MILGLTLITGLAMPLAMTGIAQVVFPRQANGSLLDRNGVVVGSALIGQNFAQPQYFHPRPSATTEPDPANPDKTRPAPYNAAASGASNAGPTSKDLLDTIKGRVAVNGSTPVPADAVTTSASGLDPHISPENAQRQVARVAAARGWPEDRVRALLAAHSEGRAFGLLGEARVNVLQLNLALDAAR